MNVEQIAYIVAGGRIFVSRIVDIDSHVYCGRYRDDVPVFYRQGCSIFAECGEVPHLVCTFATIVEAQRAIDDLMVEAFWGCEDLLAFRTLEDAEECLRDLVALTVENCAPTRMDA